MHAYFLILLTVALSSPLLAGLAGTKPNIILVLTDDQGYPPLACLGHPWIRSPHIDKLYAASTRFTHFMVAPTCSPTRSALMTGRYPEKNGVTHTILERDRLTLDATLLPQVLKTAGYTTGIFGKWHLGDEEQYQPGKRGFDEVFIHGGGGIGQAYACSNADAPGNKYTNPVIRHNGTFVQTHGFCTDVFFHAALGWIKAKSETKQPFFCYIATNAPHGPFIAPKKNAKRFTDLGFSTETAGFYGMVENIDENMGLLLAKLDDWKLTDNTLLIFMSDNGMTGGGSGVPGKEVAPGYPFDNAGQKGLKGSTDEGGCRVPFFVRWPGKIPAGRDIDLVGAHIDLLPTLAALTGAALPENQVEGRNLLPLLEGNVAGWSDRCIFNHLCRWPTGADPDKYRNVNFSVRNQRYRYVGPNEQSREGKEGRAELYDMETDPSQMTDVINEHPEIAKQMRASYDRYWKEARPLMVNETAPMSPTRPYWQAFEKQQKTIGIPEWKPPGI